MDSITIGQAIGWGIPIVLAVAGGVFGLTKLITRQNEKALKRDKEEAEKRAVNAEKQLATLSSSRGTEDAKLPTPRLPVDVKNQDVSELTEKISELEKEKVQLLDQLSEKTVSSLDPRSELSILVKQLKSDDEDLRSQAIIGLFVLKDPASFSPLIKFLVADRKEATGKNNPGILSWYELLIELDPEGGIEFAVKELESENDYLSRSAYRTLIWELKSVESIEAALPHLKNLALRSESTLGRTHSKVLLSKLEERLKDLKEKQQEKE